MATAQKRRRTKQRYSINTYTWYLLVPVVILLIVNLVPLIFTFYLSFHEWVLYRQASPEFVGLENWIDMFQSAKFWHALRVELIFVIGAVGIEFVFDQALLREKI